MGVTNRPNLIDSYGRENNIEKFNPINEVKNNPAYMGEISPVVNGLSFVLSTCLSISLSHKSLMTQPADLQENAPIVNKEIIFKLGINVGLPSISPQ